MLRHPLPVALGLGLSRFRRSFAINAEVLINLMISWQVGKPYLGTTSLLSVNQPPASKH
jgi:hypothetical protein